MELSRVDRPVMGAFVVTFILTGCGIGSTAPPALTQSMVGHATGSYGYCPALSGGTGILPDGDFSQAAQPGIHGETFYRRQLFAPSWKVRRHSIDLYASNDGYGIDGLCSVDLDGSHLDNSVGGILSNGFKTERGMTYNLTFLFSGNGFCAPTAKTMKVSAPKQFTQFTWNTSDGNDVQNGDFSQTTWKFTAAESVTRIAFRSLDPRGSYCGPMLAGITVVEESANDK